MKISEKILAIILSVLTLLSVFSVATPVVAADLQSVNAEEIVPADEDKVTEELLSEEVSESSDNELTVIGEDESRRTADTKHFIMSDGTRKAVIYGNNVHYEEDGKWIDIDNTLSYDKEKKEYKNTKNSFKATFKEDFGEENLFTLENEGYTISWEYEGNSLRKAVTKAEYKEKEKSQHKITKYAEKSEDRIKYKNFESDCELEYVVTDNGVKENIILNSKTNKNEFAFNVTAEGLTLIKNEDGSISAKNADGKEIFFIPAPFMYDSKDVYSYDVSYEIEEKNGTYTITVVADKDWLKDEARAYPVVIDPVIRTKQTKTSVSSTFVTSAVPGANYGSRQDIYVGHESANYGKCYAMFKNTLPTLNKGDMVVGAYLNLYLYNTSFDGGSSQRQLDAHIITSSWAENSVTWNTKPTYNSVITDYCFMNNGEATWKSFDITKAVKGWYEGAFTNHGILIKNDDETLTPARGIFRSENATSITEGIPYIAIDYRNNKGIEGYWSYSSFSNGVGGTAGINDYTGNLVYTLPLTSSVSEIMPVSLSLVYNTYCSSETYTAGKNNSNLTSVGKGWRLNYQQTLLASSNYGLTGTDAENYPYVYTDGDGTEHYIAKFTENGQTVYKDEDGLGYTFSKPGGTTDFYRLTQDDGSYMSFNNCGNLSQIVDNSGNKITLTYDSTNKKLTKITDGTGHTFTLNYTSGSNYLYSITDNAGRTTRTCVYTNGILTDVILNDGSRVYFRYYSTEDNPLYYVWNTDGIGRSFVYTSLTTGRRVNKTMDFSADDVNLTNYILGQVTTFDRSLYNTTTIRTPGIDGIHSVTSSANANDDIVTTLQFDNFGRTVSQQASYGWGEEIGAGAYTYTGNDEEESRHKIASSATLNKNSINLLANPSAESLSGYYINNAGDVAYTYACTDEESYYGNKSIKVNTTSMSQYSYVRIGQTISTLQVNHYYTLSAYVKLKNISLRDYKALQGAVLEVVPRNSSGTGLNYLYSSAVKNVTSEDIDNGWRRISVRFCVPENTSTVDVRVLFVNAIGTLYVDGLQLEEGTTPNSVNLLENASFEKYTSTGITNWTATGFTYSAGTNGVTTTAHKDGSTAIRLAGSGTIGKGFYQTIPVAPNPNDTYIVSGWGAAYAVNSTFHDNAKFEIAVRVTYSCSDGTTVTQYKDSAVFNTTLANWQYASSAFSLAYKKESGDTKTYTPTHIMVMPRFNRQANYAYFDHIQLIKDVASSYIYDSKGNVTSVSANAEQKNNMTYEGEDLKTYKDAAGQTTSYTYDAKHRLTQVKSPKGVKQNYTYNNKGQVTAVEDVNTGGGAKVRTTTTYTDDYSSYGLSAGAYTYKTTNELGKTTTYGHYLDTGAPSSVTDAKGNKTSYTYTDNTHTKLLDVASGNTKVTYTYTGNRVSQILFSGTDNKKETYSFGYDSFGNVKTTSVGQGANAKALVTNIYGSNNGLLQKSTYANGDAIRYSYNNAGLVTAIYHNNNQESTSPAFTWEYSSNGTPRSHIDDETDYRYDYSYDSIGRLIRTDISDKTSSAYVGSTEYGYDIRNNLTSITNDIGGAAFTQLYGYGATSVAGSAENAKDNLPTRYAILGVNTDYYYNSLNQLTKREVGISGNPITNSYTYNTVTINNTLYYTNQLAREDIENDKYYYSYDDVGNITLIRKSTNGGSATNYRAYTYDNLYRLKTETLNNSTVNSWEYDDLGNITSKTSVAGSTKTGIDYVYGTSSSCGWENLLTSVKFVVYNGDGSKTVTKQDNIYYDAIGNPYSYRGAIMGWYGRQMTTYSKNGISASFTYDADGLRSTKTVGTAKTEYQYVGDKLFYEKRGDGNSFYYFYDSYGKLSAIYHYVNGTRVPYHVVTNAQGDVMALYNWSGTKVAEYSYDAWGNCTIVSDSTSTHIATLNPFRYRSYYYDNDLALYYLQSRYYDAEIGRFINADGTLNGNGDIMGFNMYAYCSNNPVMFSDPNGFGKIWDFFCSVLDILADLFTSDVGIKIAEASDKKNGTNKTPILKTAGDIKNCVDDAKISAELANDAYTAIQDWGNHVDNILGYGMYGDDYTPKPLSKNYDFGTGYKQHCITTYNEINNRAPVAYDAPLSQLDAKHMAEFRHNLLTEDKIYGKQFIKFYGKEIEKIASEYYGSMLQ